MKKEEVKLLENSQLMCYLLISRDNLTNIKKAMLDERNDSKNTQLLEEMFDEEKERYECFLVEIYRRMNNGRKK